MAVLKNRTQANFTIVSNTVLRDKGLKMKDRGVLCTILSFHDNWEFSVEGLASLVPDCTDAVRDSVKRLEELGYLRRTRKRNSKGQFESVIEVTTERSKPDPSRKNRDGKTVEENPRRKNRGGKTVEEKSAQYNTDNIKQSSNKDDIKSINHSEDLNELQNELFIPEWSLNGTKRKINYQRLKEALLPEEIKYVDKILMILAYKRSNPKGDNDLKVGGKYIPEDERMAHILKYGYEEVYAVAKNMAKGNIDVNKPDSYYLTALDRQLQINSQESYNSISDDE
jgi:hypothetical protein